MESYILKQGFSAAFDRMSYSGLLLQLKSIGVGGSVLSICREFLSNLSQRFVVDGAIVRKPADRSAVAASLTRNLARIQE